MIIDKIRKFNCQSPYHISESVAIVGNAGKIIGSNLGKEIDSFENVIRFNNAKVKGYENDVGSKTTDIVINCHVYNDEPSLKTDGFTAWVSSEEMFSKWSDDVNIVYVNTNPASNGRGSVPERFPFYIMDKNFFDYTSTSLNPYGGGLPTIGYAFVATLAYHGIKPVLFGFSMPGDQKWDHYFEGRPAPSVSHNHSVEKQALQRMWEDGFIDVR